MTTFLRAQKAAISTGTCIACPAPTYGTTARKRLCDACRKRHANARNRAWLKRTRAQA